MKKKQIKLLVYLLLFQVFFLKSCAFLKENIMERSISIKRLHLEKLWIFNTLDEDYFDGRLNYRSSPLIIKNLIIQGNSVNGIIALDKKKGLTKWKLSIKNGIESSLYTNGENIFFGANDGYFYSVKAKSGSIQWKKNLNSEGFGPALLHKGILYFISGEDILYALDEKTGKRLWLYKNTESSSSFFSIRGSTQPFVFHNLLYVGFKTGHLVALDRETGRFKWRQILSSVKDFKDVDSNPIVQNKRLYAASYNGGLYCLEAKTGKKIWSIDEGSHAGVTLSSSELLYYSTANGKVLAIDKNSGKIIWTYKLAKGIATQPTLFRGLLFFGESSGSLKALDAKNGQFVQEFHPGLGLMAKPTIDPLTETLYFISNDANLFAIKLYWKSKRQLELEKGI